MYNVVQLLKLTKQNSLVNNQKHSKLKSISANSLTVALICIGYVFRRGSLAFSLGYIEDMFTIPIYCVIIEQTNT